MRQENNHLHRLLSRKKIASIVQGLADQIFKDYHEKELVLVCILKGAFIFLSDLVRALKIPVQIDFVRISSYGSGTKSSGTITITKDIEISIENKNVLIIEDIIDSGRTVQFLKNHLSLLKPHSVKVCSLLDKKSRREVDMEADYLGMDVDDVFIVGYGIDFNERYRHLSEIYYVTPSNDPKK